MIVWLFLPGSQRRAFPVENELCVSCRRLEIWPRAQRSAAFEHEMWIVDWPEDERPARCAVSPAVSRCRAVRGARQLGSSALCSHGCLNMLEPAGHRHRNHSSPLRPGIVYEVWCDMDLTRATIYLSAVGPAVGAGLVWTY